MSVKFRHAKSLGQNFLIDNNIADEIIEGSCIDENDMVIEIGPGMGILTREIVERASYVVAIEIDTRLISILERRFAAYDNIKILNEDVMKCDLNALIQRYKPLECNAVRVIGNLPYYITTPIIMKLLEEKVEADSITVMIQKKVAERIMAEPGSKACGAVTASISYYCTGEKITDAPAAAFDPRPKVDSTVIRLDLRKNPPVELMDKLAYFEVVRYGFAKRRKTLLNALIGMRNMDKEAVTKVLESAGIDSRRRAETLNIQEIADIANAVVSLKYGC